jgi:hypothetical protein
MADERAGVAQEGIGEEIVDGWRQWVTDDGYPYFHNDETGETTWEEPEAVRLHRLADQEPDDDAFAAEVAFDDEDDDDEAAWAEAERLDAERRAKKEQQLAQAEQPEATADATPDEEEDPHRWKVKDVIAESERARVLRACAEFQELLSQTGLDPSTPWDVALPRLAVDPRFSGIKAMHIRKELYQWWCKRRHMDHSQMRVSLDEAHKGLLAFLRACVADGTLGKPGLTFASFRDALCPASVRHACVAMGGDAERLFHEHLPEARRVFQEHEQERLRAEREQSERTRIAAEEAFLSEIRGSSTDAEWAVARERETSIGSHIASDPRWAGVLSEDELERLYHQGGGSAGKRMKHGE